MNSSASSISKHELEHGETLSPQFNADGLITAIVQDSASGEILMLAHMNQDALTKTLETGQAHFWSRSRQELWLKGETSGNILNVDEVRIDCDQDAVLIKAKLSGTGACHTGERSCFYRTINVDGNSIHLTKD